MKFDKDVQLSRRRFLQAGSALVVSFTLTSPALAMTVAAPGAAGQAKSLDPKGLDAYLALHADGRVTVYTGKVDLGTGNMTALAQIVAEEMEVPFDQITMVQGDTALTVDQGVTFGSLSIQVAGVTLRQAGATAREALKRRAASEFGVPVEQIGVKDGRAFATGAPAKSLPYATLLHDRILELPLDTKVALKNPRQYTVVGESIRREDIPGKVTGESTYMHDIRVPGMLHARVIRPAALGARLISVDEASIGDLKDVRVLRKGNFLAVVARKEWTAVKAARQLKVQWSDWSGLPEQAKVYDALRALEVVDKSVMAATGNIEQGLAAPGAQTLKARYAWPAQTHGSIGPSCAIAEYKEGRMTLWSATQGPHLTRKQIAAMLKLPVDRVRLIYAEGAGCYGRNGHEDATADAALLAMELGVPIRVQWMRHDEHGWDPKGPPVVNELTGAIDSQGRIVAWRHETWEPYRINPSADVPLLADELLRGSTIIEELSNPGSVEKNAAPTYVVPNVSAVVNKTKTTFFRASWLRGPGRLQNTFANESFIDEMAALAGIDPIELRLRHLDDARGIAVLKAAAAKAGWQSRAPGSQHKAVGDIATGRGVAYVRYDGDRTYVAAIADVEVNRKTGAIRLAKFTIAHDCGLVVNPDGVVNQIEGQVVQTLSRTLHEELGFSRSAITSLDWASYKLLRFPEVPKIDVVLLNQPDKPAWGAGEPACSVVPSAVAGAVYDAIGVRLRTVPFKAADVLAALNS
ncbi:xanthine dehydrogenase family protein molybdopterin-binding subunit [Noviherbaspirillum pedocola]|uniref:Xanthine dehydrogenase family protein molybdopterin-binding subunit n=1 Tax=Noviherbaspirillum pedocola TaxID=2801341 RepID=A0A934SXF6_9BURK|nr:molybdopterin cofactor-binding domain-containing protein [Noviherbaspirillum pedocola]MBK4737283.1 xanthine dehydrogenase family protein molybdopterin-binding subunit [Noviherbaspirillum pedocola]